MRMVLVAVAALALLGSLGAAFGAPLAGALNGLFTARQSLIVSPVQADATIARSLSSYSQTMASALKSAPSAQSVTDATVSSGFCYGTPCVTSTLGSQTTSGYLQPKDAQDVASSMNQGQ